LSKVAIANGENPIEATKKVIDLLGGMEKFINQGDIIFLKPDLSTPIGVPASTDPLVIGTISKLCLDCGAEKILIGDNPFGGVSSKNLYKYTGLGEYLKDLGVELKYLEKEVFESVKVPNPNVLKKVKLPKCVLNSDKLISIPTMRTDILSDVALSIRNLHGLLPDEQYFAIYKERIHYGLIDILKVVKPDLIIIDSFIGGEGQGPFTLSGIETMFNLGSSDPVAIDSVATSIMGYNPENIKHLKLAQVQNLGVAELDQIKIIGDKIRRFEFKKAKLLPDNNNLLEIQRGKCCSGCLASFRIFSDLMTIFLGKELKNYGGFTCLLGKNPDVSYYKRGIIVFGDCAIYSTHSYDFKTNRKIKKTHRTQEIPGCPPIDLNIFEKITLNFKDKIPAFELINEILKRWTRGRKLKTPRHPTMED